jgi:hypothetical protein
MASAAHRCAAEHQLRITGIVVHHRDNVLFLTPASYDQFECQKHWKPHVGFPLTLF